MRSLMFSFKPDISQQQQENALAEINSIEGIHLARLLKPNAKDPEVSRMGFVYVKDEADIENIRNQLAGLEVLNDPTDPTVRQLIR